MKLHIVPARTGVAWVRLGLQTFFRQPLAFISLFFFFMAVVMLVQHIPLIGSALSLMLLPAITLALMTATAQTHQASLPSQPLGTDASRPVTGSVFLAALQAVRANVPALAMLGVLYAVGFLALVGVSTLADGGKFANVYLFGHPLTQEAAQAPDFQIALWLTMLLYLPLSLAFWHAPALAHWHGVTPVKSIFFSMVACVRNFGALFLFGLAWFGIFIMAGIALSLVVSILVALGAMGGGNGIAYLGSTLIGAAAMVMAAMFFSSLWFTYRDCFEEG